MTLTITPPKGGDRFQDILSKEALAFVEELHGRFGARRTELPVDSPMFVHNLTMWAALVGSGAGMFVLCREITGQTVPKI